MAIFSGGVLWSDFCSGDISSVGGGTAFADIFTDPNGDGSWLMADPEIFFMPLDFQSANTVTTLRVKCTLYPKSNSGNEGLFVDGTNYLTTAVDETGGVGINSDNFYWHTLPGVTSFTEISWTKHGAQGSDYNTNSYVLVKGIEVNGQVLLDTPAVTNAQGVQLGSVTTGLGFHNYMLHFTNGMTSTNTPSFTFSSVDDVLSPYVPRDLTSFFAATSVGVPDQYPDRIHKPVRPSGGQQYPRGNRGN